jgi:hypothetical protein
MIVGVAIKHNGKTYKLPKPNRHIDIMMFLWSKDKNANIKGGSNQGFYDDKGNYLDRQAAMIHAKNCGQIKSDFLKGKVTLFSEDLW